MYRVALADDHALFRHTLALFLKTLGNFDIVIEASNGEDLMKQLSMVVLLPDVIFMDIQMPVMDGRHASMLIRRLYPGVKIIVLSVFSHEDLVNDMFYLGVSGFLSKSIEHEMLRDSVNAVMRNERYLYRGEKPALCGQVVVTPVCAASKKVLTDKQKSFLQFCATGLTYKEIATEMNISLKTVDRYREELFHKLNVKNRVELSIYAVKNGLVNLYSV